jgi:hypothetical protein
VAGGVKVAPSAGCVSVTLGSESLWTLTIRATEGTLLASKMKSM